MTDIVRPTTTTMHVDPMANQGGNITTTTTPLVVKDVDDSTNNIQTPSDDNTNSNTKASNLHPVRRAQIIAECVRQGYYRTPSCNDKLHLHFKGHNSFEAHCLDDYTDCKVLWMEGNCFTDESFHSSVICTTEDKHIQEDEDSLSAAAGVNHPPAPIRRSKGDAPPVPVFEASPEGPITGGPSLLASQAPVLRSMYLHQNLLHSFPSIAAACQRLDSLNISDNFITSLSRGGLVTPMWMWPSEILSALDDIIADRKNNKGGGGVPIPDVDVGSKIDASGLCNLLLNGSVDCVGLAQAARELAVQSVMDERVRAAERKADEECRMERLMSYGNQLKKETAADTEEGGDASEKKVVVEEESGVKVAAAALEATNVLCEEALEALSPIAKSIHSHHGVFGWVPLSIGMWDLVIKQIIMTEGLMLLPPPAAEVVESAAAAEASNNNKASTSPSKSRQKEEDDEASLGAFLTAMGGDAAPTGITSDMMPVVENYGVTSRPDYLRRYRRACQFAVHLRNATYPFNATALPGGGAVPKQKDTEDNEDDTPSPVTTPPEALVNTLTWIQIKNNHLRSPIELLPLLLCARLSALDLSGNRIDDGDALLIFLEHTYSVGVGEWSTTTTTDEEEGTASWVAPIPTDDNDDAAAASSSSQHQQKILPASTPYYHLKSLMLHGNPAVRSITQYRKRVLSTIIGGYERGASMLGPEGKAVPRGLSYLDDRPVFDNERRLVVAWAAGGLDGEKRERETIKSEEENAVQQRLKDFKSMMRRAAAAAGVTLNRSNSATASASSSLGGMITIEDDDDDDRPTSSDEDEDESSDGATVRSNNTVATTIAAATIARAAPVPDNKAEPASVEGTTEEERNEFYRRNYTGDGGAATTNNDTAPSSSTTDENGGVAWNEFAIRNNNTTTTPALSMADQAAQRAQEAAGRRGIVIIDDVDDDDDEDEDDETTTAP